jgi:signal transduction histidine kinase/ActR/RegA family two-component response regulator
MGTTVDISLLVGVAAALTLISLILLIYLWRTTPAQFRRRTLLYGTSTLCLLAAVLGVLLSGTDTFVLSATLIVGGAHFGILSAYLAFRQDARKALDWRILVLISAGLCLAQTVLALATHDIALLMISSSLVNIAFCIFAVWDLMRLAHARLRLLAFLASLPFVLIGLCYLLRLVLVTIVQDGALAMMSTAVIAFMLGVSSMHWGFVLILDRDAWLIGQLKQARRMTETLSQQRTRAFAQINHEIRTPLNGILGLSELLKPHLPKGEGAELLKELQSSGNLLLSIVNEVLDFSKAEAGHVQLEAMPLDISDVLRAATTQYRRIARSKDVGLDLHISPDPFPAVIGDPTRLNQIFHNLLSNALKFTHAGKIEVSLTHLPQEGVEITISDSGIGMTDEQVASLFVPFQQASVETTRHYGGTGLGMSIVRMLVDAMQGEIRVSSQPGQGTAITLILPLPETRLEQDKDLPAAPVDLPGLDARLAILCVDDDPINRMVLEALLKSFGVQPVVAEDGPEAIRLAGMQHFDAYLVDISMPGMDGIETLRGLRQAERADAHPRPLAIATTANVMEQDVRSYATLGFDGYLSKPILRHDLEKILLTILQPAA